MFNYCNNNKLKLKGAQIAWFNIKQLCKLLECEGLHLENKLKSAYIAWFKKKNIFDLTVQLLSEPPAKAKQILS